MPIDYRDVIIEAMSLIGTPYRFGAETSKQDASPAAIDCSELIEWACARAGVGPRMPDGSWNQFSHAVKHDYQISVPAGLKTRGALLFYFSGGDPLAGQRPKRAHVAISLGDGRVLEASSTARKVTIAEAEEMTKRGGTIGNRVWTHAAMIPGVSYHT
jgi:cell wall-associated NlpC family hydrolase